MNMSDILVPLLTALLGYFTGWQLEKQKWQRELDAKFQEEKREAIAKALEWVDPLRQAIIRATALCSVYYSGEIEEREFISEYPDSHWRLDDPPARLRVSLPKLSYPKVNSIKHGLDKLRYSCLQRQGFDVSYQIVNNLEKQIDEFEQYLQKEYKKTFVKVKV